MKFVEEGFKSKGKKQGKKKTGFNFSHPLPFAGFHRERVCVRKFGDVCAAGKIRISARVS
jgi:hypothetical protein